MKDTAIEMQIERATIENLNDIAFLFDRYRVFYRQASNIDLAKSFIQARLQQQDTVIFLATENTQPLGYTNFFLLGLLSQCSESGFSTICLFYPNIEIEALPKL